MTIVSIEDVNQEYLGAFSCGVHSLDDFLKRHALNNDKNGYGKTFIMFSINEIVGYFTLSSSCVVFDEFPEKYEKMPRYPIPCIKIARLAVDNKHQREGMGKELLKQAFLKIFQVSDTVGLRFITADLKEESLGFYLKYGFKPLTNKVTSLYLPLDTLVMAVNSK